VEPGFVFVHGGGHTGECWQPTIAAIGALDPDVATLAVDLPGRRGEPGDLALSIAQCVASVVRQIDDAGMHRVVLVGHSMAGITLPGVITALGPDRAAGAVYIACCVPPEGRTVMSTLRPPVSWIATAVSRFASVSKPMPAPAAKWMFANGMSSEAKRAVVAGLVAESTSVTREPVTRADLPSVPTTWVLTKRDRSLRPSAQREFAANLGRVDEIVEIDTCHNVMMSEPDALARVLLARR
jgi:pimeloyl-ACP methyl ester carboxylesterase